MINELFQLSETLKDVDIKQTEWNMKYKNIPKSTAKDPCLCLMIDSEGHIRDMIGLGDNEAKNVRKYGNNQGTFPALNILPLYVVPDNIFKELESMRKKPELFDLDKVKSWCTKSAWNDKLFSKLKISFVDVPNEMKTLLDGCTTEAAQDLSELVEVIHKGGFDSDYEKLHDELRDFALAKLEKRELVSESLKLLLGKDEKTVKNLSVVFDLYDKSPSHLPVIASPEFTNGLNQLLVEADYARVAKEKEIALKKKETAFDAFQIEFAPSDDPMPEVKLPSFDMKLYSMFSEVKCQNRYDNFNKRKYSYPLSFENRSAMKKSLEWISKDSNKGKTWMSLGSNAYLFCYPTKMPKVPIEWAAIFGDGGDKDSEYAFSARAKRLIDEIKNLKVDSELNFIEVFALWKVDKARTKIVQSGTYSFGSVQRVIREWSEGCANLPVMQIKEIPVLYPLQVPRVMNQVWKQDGTQATTANSTITVKKLYEGIDFFFNSGKKPDEKQMLRDLLIHAEGLIIYAGDMLHKKEKMQGASYGGLRKVIPTAALLLYRLGERKENYMKSYSYLLGQLLHISDELHAFYCQVVRDGSVPPKLAGSELYSAAAESPEKTLALLGTRMLPYISWAKSYRFKKVMDEGIKSAYAGRYLWLYQETMNQLALAGHDKTRFNDAEKAELFIGYLASLPKRESADETDHDSKSAE